nr:DUF6577 family protein [Pedobacter indicus]
MSSIKKRGSSCCIIQTIVWNLEEIEYYGSGFQDKKTISWRIHDMKTKGNISHVSRGLYSLKSKTEFKPEISNIVNQINNKLIQEFPFIQFCLWESKWFNEFMVHQLFKNYIVVETEKEVMESVFNSFSDLDSMTYLNPDRDIFELYISSYDEVIIVKQLVSEAPINVNDQGMHIASLEKLLVDILIERDLLLPNRMSWIMFLNRLSKSIT